MPQSETATLKERIRAIEDRLGDLQPGSPAIRPGADTGADYYTRTVYAEDGVFDRGPHTGGAGRDAVAAVVKTPEHQAAINGGLAHFCGLPYVELDGDHAAVTSYLQILMPDPNGLAVELPNHGTSKGFRIHRVAANRWELVRTDAGWKIKRRTLRPLDGSGAGAARFCGK